MEEFGSYFLKLWLLYSIVNLGSIANGIVFFGDTTTTTTEGYSAIATNITVNNKNNINNNNMTSNNNNNNTNNENSNNNNNTNNSLENFNVTDNFSVYDQKHKVLLVVLSDLNVRKVNGKEQAILSNPAEPNTEETKVANETFVLDERKFKELLESKKNINRFIPRRIHTELQPTAKKEENESKCAEIKKCEKVIPHYVPPTFPLLIRKDKRRPIAYIDSISCEDQSNESKNGNKKTNTGSRSGNKPQSWQRSRSSSYVLVPKLSFLNFYNNVNSAQASNGRADPRAYYWSSEEYE